MEELREFLDTIILVLRRNNVVRDVRRIILNRCIFDEFIERDRANCVGPAYSILSRIMLKPCFAQAYIIYTVTSSKLQIQTHLHITGPVLLTRAATDFILDSKILQDVPLPINHRSEKLGILTRSLCTRLITIYIDREGLSMTGQYRGHVKIDGRLSKLLDSIHPPIAMDYIDGHEHMKFHEIPKLVQRTFVHFQAIRYVSAALKDQLQLVEQYCLAIRDKQSSN